MRSPIRAILLGGWRAAARLGTPVRRIVRRRRSDRSAARAIALATRIPALTAARAALPLRVLIEEALPDDPLQDRGGLPPIDIVVPCHPKDAQRLGVVIDAAVEASRNPVARVLVVTPGGEIPGLRCSADVVHLRDDDLIDSGLRKVLAGLPRERRGWGVQQLVKFEAARTSAAPGVLVVDADTVLLRRRTWLDDSGTQLLAISHEYHADYARHTASRWPGLAPVPGLSYVTHHQLLQREIVARMFPAPGDLAGWASSGDWGRGSPVSEYHSYGTWLAAREPERIRWARWGNTAAPADTLADVLDGPLPLERLRRRYPDALSVSFHSYMT